MYLSEEHIKLGKEFEKTGYIIRPIADTDALARMETIFRNAISEHLDGMPIGDLSDWLNESHKHVPVDQLNDFRLKVINAINSDSVLRSSYFDLARPYLEALVGNELAMQRRVNLSIQYPEDDTALLPVHADTWSGDSPFEVVVWVPLVDCFGTKAMYILPPEANDVLKTDFANLSKGNSERLFDAIADDLIWIEIKRGEVLIFNQTLPHGNRVNAEKQTRWSMNCRFKSVFTPYADKKIGEFFEPITLRPVSKLGLDYELPKI
jgi:sporadic carbohydrate cluster 2OG-Fe(II) oxygenase